MTQLHLSLLRMLFIVQLFLLPLAARSQCITLTNAFAHNDYRHKYPLLEAEKNGYSHIEADVFLHRNKLVVAHINPFFKGRRTLENLYLIPLLEKIQKNNGRLYVGCDESITLMIDIKTDAEKTYAALKPLLEKYRSILTSYDSNRVTIGAVTIVLSGNKPYDVLRREERRLAFIDKDLRKAPRDTASNIFTMASCKYSKLLKWRGEGRISIRERQRLCDYVTQAHQNGERVRLWGSPDNKAVWKEMLNCGVDLINTDKLVPLRNFLLANASVL